MLIKVYIVYCVLCVSSFVESSVLIYGNSEKKVDLIYCRYLNNKKHVSVCKHELGEQQDRPEIWGHVTVIIPLLVMRLLYESNQRAIQQTCSVSNYRSTSGE